MLSFVLNSFFTHSTRTFKRFSDFKIFGMSEISSYDRSSLEKNVFDNLCQGGIELHKTRILLSVSGGCDSMAMMHIFARIKRDFATSLTLEVVNFNHKRRPEADNENNARNWRRQESIRIAQSNTNGFLHSYIATAHHKEDQLETVLMKLLRGAHISNLQTMSLVDGMFLKPLLIFRKTELRNYLEKGNLTWHEDSSNESRDYTRNKVRLDAIPLLADLAGGAEALESRLLALSAQSNDVKQLVNFQCSIAMKSLKYRYYPGSLAPFSLEMDSSFALQPSIVISEILHSWIEKEVGLSLSYSRMSTLVEMAKQPLPFGQRETAMTISGEWDVQRVGSELRLLTRKGILMGRYSSSHFSMLGSPSGRKWTLYVTHPEHVNIEAFADELPEKKTSNKEEIENEFRFCLHNIPIPSVENNWTISLALRYVNLEKDKIKLLKLGRDKNDGGISKTERVRDILKRDKLPVHRRDRRLVLCSPDGSVAALLGSDVHIAEEFFLARGATSSVCFHIVERQPNRMNS